MSTSLASSPARMHAKDLRARLDEVRAPRTALRIDANSADLSQETAPFRALVRDAMRRAGLSQKAFAITCGQSESVISEALSGTRHLAAEWLWAQEDAFWVELRGLIDAARQITPDTARAVKAERIVELVRLLVEEVA